MAAGWPAETFSSHSCFFSSGCWFWTVRMPYMLLGIGITVPLVLYSHLSCTIAGAEMVLTAMCMRDFHVLFCSFPPDLGHGSLDWGPQPGLLDLSQGCGEYLSPIGPYPSAGFVCTDLLGCQLVPCLLEASRCRRQLELLVLHLGEYNLPQISSMQLVTKVTFTSFCLTLRWLG